MEEVSEEVVYVRGGGGALGAGGGMELVSGRMLAVLEMLGEGWLGAV